MAADKINFNESSISALSNDLNGAENNIAASQLFHEHGNETPALPYSQNLITYELHRINTNIGFGFDLKGEKPAMVGSIRKSSIAEQAGLREGDLVISINNKKVTDLDHDSVVRLIGLTKRTLILQVTKVKYSQTNSDNTGFMINNNQLQIYQNLQSHLNHNKLKSTSKKLNRKLSKQAAVMLDRAQQQDQIPTAASLMYVNPDELNNHGNNLTNNTKTTEDDEEDDSDCDYDYYLMTGRRRRNRRHHHHHHH
jgi:hypothetical protein